MHSIAAHLSMLPYCPWEIIPLILNYIFLSYCSCFQGYFLIYWKTEDPVSCPYQSR